MQRYTQRAMPQQIEKQSKFWKAFKLTGIIPMVVSLPLVMMTCLVEVETSSGMQVPITKAALAVFLIGLAVYVVAAIGSWWDHG